MCTDKYFIYRQPVLIVHGYIVFSGTVTMLIKNLMLELAGVSSSLCVSLLDVKTNHLPTFRRLPAVVDRHACQSRGDITTGPAKKNKIDVLILLPHSRAKNTCGDGDAQVGKRLSLLYECFVSLSVASSS